MALAITKRILVLIRNIHRSLIIIIWIMDYMVILLNFIFGMEWLNINRRC